MAYFGLVFSLGKVPMRRHVVRLLSKTFLRSEKLWYQNRL